MKLAIVIVFTLVSFVRSECDVKNYKKIGCFNREGSNLNVQIFNKSDDQFDLSNYKAILPELVCECMEKTKDEYRYFAVGKNGHCFAGKEFNDKSVQSSKCVGPVEYHQGGLESAEYVYQIKADAATPKNGGVTEYGEWSACSASCGGGKRSRERACVNPLPNDPGKGCKELTQEEECNKQPCPVDGKYGPWSQYSKCSATCGQGTKKRTRKCDSPKPAYGGKSCDGKSQEIADCKLPLCVTKSETIINCEGDKVSINCAQNWKIKIEYGNYGRTTDHVCTAFYNIHWSTDCKTGEDKIRAACEGKESCKIDVTNDNFGDPCKWTRKYLELKYHCEGFDL